MKISNRLFRYSLLLFLLTAFALIHSPLARAQQFYFGQNRVQYKEFNWRYIKSKHFDVYYYQTKNYGLATFTALTLEAGLKQIDEDFGHQLNNRIPVVVYDSHNDFAQTNVAALPVGAEAIGGVTEPFKNRIAIPFGGEYGQYFHTLEHELVHAVINDMFYGGGLGSRIRAGGLQIPAWFNEGMAEYQSQGWDTETDSYMRDAVINDELPPLSRLGGFFGDYQAGQSFWNFIVEQYGRHKITEIFQGMKNYRNIPTAFKRSLGLSVEELSKKWQSFYKKRYSPEVAKRNNIDETGELVSKDTKDAFLNTSPAYSPQGDKIAMLTSARGVIDLIVVNAITGKKIKTLIKGNESVNFESLKILKPNISWSPDGRKIALSTLSKGKDQLAIVNYETEAKQYIKFPNVDAIGGVAWSPDGNKIAFAGHIGTFSDIFVYNLNTKKLKNVTNDVISDTEPAWGPDSKTIYFSSGRGDHLQLGQVRKNADLLLSNDMYSTDIYSLTLGEDRVQRLTKTPGWDEYQPETTHDGRLVFVSDENGIPNVYQLNLADRTTAPLTNLLIGARQISMSEDGSRLAIATIHDQKINIYSIRAPFSNKQKGPLENNTWADRRAGEPLAKMIPATAYVKDLASTKKFVSQKAKQNFIESYPKLASKAAPDTAAAPANAIAGNQQAPDTLANAQPDTIKPNNNNINFRNYVFSPSVTQDTTFTKKYLKKNVFAVKNNTTDDDRYIPKDYRLKFTTDILAGQAGIGIGGGGYGYGNGFGGANNILQARFSDLLGNHILSVGSSLQFNLNNSSYFVQYATLKHRVNWLYSVSHTSYNFGNFGNVAERFRYFIGGVTAQYPLNRFQRVDFSLNGVSISDDLASLTANDVNTEHSAFLLPSITFTNDKSLPGFITPIGGFRYAVELSASPPITGETLQFASLQGDFRKYFHLGGRYSFAVRGSFGASTGRDSQTFFLGGMEGWINRKYSNATIPRETIGRSFIAQPAIPLRGYDYFALTGNKYGLANAEFRFPLFAALLPGPIPILPLYNLTGVAFIDAGTAWGEDIPYQYFSRNPNPNLGINNGQTYFVNDKSLNFKLRKVDRFQPNGADLPEPKGDILVGAGFGLRTIIFGLPLRYDIAWPYYRDGFGGDPVNYITIGIDF